ncbi:MAG: 2-dehydropantoate 2-reductase [Proteobacteria bacterium]|nr:2-dehydropantoate 2-reductase [Pseudomonadota bacterium]MDA1022127.1 2-dehydropantoate 2-reductase [Pseudomonadota bacterium]
MKICVIGAGAIGGMMGAKLALSGQDVSVIDQGQNLQAIQENGLKLIWEDGTEYVADVSMATDKVADVGEQDLIILGLKAHYLEQVAKEIPKITGPDTMIVTVQNGIPWWYFHNHGGPFEGQRLESLDPDGVLGKHIDGDKIIGCVVYPAATVEQPGVIRHVEGDRFPIGELDGSESERVLKLQGVLEKAGFRSRVLDDIRSEIWLKAWGNLSFNPISALTHATLIDICQFAETRKLAEQMMREAQEIAEKLGITFRHTIEKRIAGAEGVGSHKTSMLQDVEAGRSLETEALIGAILELGQLTETPAPSIQAVYACVKLLNKVMLLEGAGVRVSNAA